MKKSKAKKIAAMWDRIDAEGDMSDGVLIQRVCDEAERYFHHDIDAGDVMEALEVAGAFLITKLTGGEDE